MTKKQFIKVLLLSNFILGIIILTGFYFGSDLMTNLRSAFGVEDPVAPEEATEELKKSLVLGTNYLDDPELFIVQDEEKFSLLLYENTVPQVLFVSDIVNIGIPIQNQVQLYGAEDIVYIASDGYQDYLYKYNLAAEREEILSTSDRLKSVSVSADGSIYVLQSRLSSGNQNEYDLFRISPVGLREKLVTFNAVENYYILKATSSNVLLADNSLQNCRVFLAASGEVLTSECTKDVPTTSAYFVLRELTSTTGSVPESYPGSGMLFKETVYIQKEYDAYKEELKKFKDIVKPGSTNPSDFVINEPKPIYRGDVSRDLQLLYWDREDKKLFILSKNVDSEIVRLVIVNTDSREALAAHKLPIEGKTQYLGSDGGKKFYFQVEVEESRDNDFYLVAFDSESEEFTEYEAPICETDCEYINLF